MLLMLYRALTTVAAPAVRAYLELRVRRGKEDRARLPERLGLVSRPRPEGALVWLHAASVGEAQSALSLIARLRAARPDAAILVTTGTASSARLLAGRLPDGAFHQFVPVDRAAWVRRFLDHWRPDLALWVESELWPNLVVETAARAIPMVLLNGRISPRSFVKWLAAPRLAGRILGAFALVFAQSEAEAERLRTLGATRVLSVGNLKYAAQALAAEPDAEAALRRAIGTRPVWLAASTHEGEERIAGAVHRRLAARHPGLLTIVAPRHPARGQAIERALAGLSAARRGAGALPDAGTEIYIADTMGEMGLLYALAPVVLMGGSLVPHGGQNLLEPARRAAAILHGPHMHNFAEIVRAMGDAVEEVRDEAELAGAVDRLLSDATLRARRGAEARTRADAQSGVLDRVMAEIAPLLERSARRTEGHARA